MVAAVSVNMRHQSWGRVPKEERKIFFLRRDEECGKRQEVNEKPEWFGDRGGGDHQTRGWGLQHL